jgi:hypothetical protein
MVWDRKDYEDKCYGFLIYDVLFANIT